MAGSAFAYMNIYNLFVSKENQLKFEPKNNYRIVNECEINSQSKRIQSLKEKICN